MNTMLGIVLVLGVMILVHEWGHFIVARLFGVRVDVFSIGFGPRLFGWKRGATDYRISALPLGGYVRMAGQDLMEIDSGEKGPTGAPGEVMSKKRAGCESGDADFVAGRIFLASRHALSVVPGQGAEHFGDLGQRPGREGRDCARRPH